MAEAEILGPSGEVVGTLTIPDGASPEVVQQMAARAKVAALARVAAVEAGHPEPDTFVRQIGAESSFRADAVGPVTKSGERARGPAQFMPGTARQYGVEPGGDPTDDLRGGAEYSRDMIQQFGGDVRLGLAAYNAGPGNVEKYGGVPPFPETQRYVETIGSTPSAPAPPALPMMTDAMDPVARQANGAPLHSFPPVMGAMAGEGAPPKLDVLNTPERYGEAGMRRMGDILLPLAFPPAASVYGAAAMGATAAVIAEGVDQYRNGTEPDWKAVGKAALLGGAVGAAAHGVVNAVAGRPAPDRRAAERTLGMPGFTDPVPVTTSGRAHYAAEVDEALLGVLPPTSREAVGRAYHGFRQEVGGRAIDVTAYNRTLQHYADVRFPGERLPAPARLLDPVGRMQQIPGRAPRWVASADEVLASERGLSFASGTKNATGQPTLPGGLMKALRGDLTRSLNQSLTPGEQAAYQAAKDTAQAVARRERAVRLLTSKTMTDGTAVNVGALASRLEKAPERYRQQLGDALYGELLTVAQAGRTLLMQPGGRQVFSNVLARATLIGAGAAAGNEYSPGGGMLGAVTGAVAPTRLLAPHILSVLERLARTRATSGAVAEGAGRLAVALALEDAPAETPATPPPAASFPPPATPQPLGRVGAP
jgi:hypothetical protein